MIEMLLIKIFLANIILKLLVIHNAVAKQVKDKIYAADLQLV